MAFSRQAGRKAGWPTAWLWALVAGLLVALPAGATTIALNGSYAGYYNFVTTGATVRTAANGTNACSVNTGTTNAALSGIPAGSTIVKAFYYWGGSGTTNDTSATLNGSTVTADRSFADTYNQAGYDLSYFGNVADVTSLVTGNATYTFGGLTVTNTDGGGAGQTYCSSSAVAGGWGLFVIYSNASEPLRVINLYDGLQWFRGSSVTQTPSNFLIPSSPINGKIAVMTMEGDPDAFAALNGFDEALTYNGNSLTDALNPAANQFNSTINTLGSSTSYGLDYDVYSITPYLSAGATSGSMLFSTGGDLVLLMLEGVSVTSVPVSDMSISKTRVNLLGQNGPGQYRIRVGNNGPLATATTYTVTDTIAAGQTYVGYSSSDPNWSCSFSSPTLTCTNTSVIAVGATAADLFINLNITAAAGTVISNTATVSGGNTFDNISANNSSTISSTVTSSNVSTSVKTVTDLNGGDIQPGDVLRYEIDVIETAGAGANNVRVTDNIPANVTGFLLQSYPAGATNASTTTGGTNGNGFLDISGFTLAASSTAVITFDVTVGAAVPIGTVISNTANITAPANIVRAIGPTTATVLSNSVPMSGLKSLYFYMSGAATVTQDGQTIAQANALSRRVPTATTTTTVASQSGATTLTQTPVLAKALTINAGAINIYACMARNGSSQNRTVTAALSYWNGSSFVSIGTGSFATFNTTTFAMYSTAVTPASSITVPAGGYLRVILTNTTGTAARPVDITTNNANCGAAVYSRVDVSAATVINVDSVASYTAAYNGGSTVSSVYDSGQTLYARAAVSDPFGTFDINGASFQLRNAGGTTVLGPSAMTLMNTNTATGVRTYELSFTVPTYASSPYTLRVTASEGTEGLISDLGVSGLVVLQAVPVLTVTKTASTPTVQPGVPFTYSIKISNTGTGYATTVAIMDMLGKYTAFRLNTFGAGLNFQLVDGPPATGLALGTAVYSNNGGTTYTYTPVSGGGGAPAGYDAAITNFRLPMTGNMPAGSNFTVNFQAAPR